MTELQIKAFINQLNKNKPNKLIYLAELSENVDIGLGWLTKASMGERFSGPYRFYFIKNNDNIYIGAVLVMGVKDLHWYVTSKYRGMKYLSTALRYIILPHILQNTNEQRITIDKDSIGQKNFTASEQLALSVGFKRTSVKNGKCEYVLKDDHYEDSDYLNVNYKGLSDQRFKDLKHKVKSLYESLAIIQSEVRMSFGDIPTVKELDEIVTKISTYSVILEDIYYDWNER